MRFPVISADPPWRFKCWTAWACDGLKESSASRRVENQYATQSIEWIYNLPVKGVAADDCVLFLWATWPLLPEALRVIEAWGFEYKTCAFNWVKPTMDGTARMGLGYWSRANSEPCLLATRGAPKRRDKGVGQIIVAPDEEDGDVLFCRTHKHSMKPDEQYERIERLVAGPYLEMFARPHWGMYGPRPGWVHLGNEVTGNDMVDDLRALAEDRIPAGSVAE